MSLANPDGQVCVQRLIGVRVVVIEDHLLLAESLRLSLTAEGAECYVADLCSPGDLVVECLAHRPHVVLLDLDLGEPVGDGAMLISPIAATGAHVVLLTGTTDVGMLGRALDLGAVDVIEKAEALESLVEHVRRVARGERTLHPRRRLELLLEGRRRRAVHDRALAPFQSLTARECSVLSLLVRGRHVDEICVELFVSAATVRTHIRSILRKLGVRSQLAAVARAHDVGWDG